MSWVYAICVRCRGWRYVCNGLCGPCHTEASTPPAQSKVDA